MEVSSQYDYEDPPPEVAPVKISFLNNLLIVEHECRGGRAGVLVSEGLSRLVRQCSVTLAATIGAPNKRLSDFPSRMIGHIQARPLTVVVYGLLLEKDNVTKILDEGGLFLQHPDEFEYDMSVRYFNPMYLLRPGEAMPRIKGTSTAASRGQMVMPFDESQLGELEKSRVLRIFDEASGADRYISSEVMQSSRIVSTLIEYVVQLSFSGNKLTKES
jgi:SWI/SNF-related matrix-associated actin-dependent regulator of chromatin subfamily A3